MLEGDAQHVWRGYARIEDGAHMGLGVSGKHFAFVWAGSQPKKQTFCRIYVSLPLRPAANKATNAYGPFHRGWSCKVLGNMVSCQPAVLRVCLRREGVLA